MGMEAVKKCPLNCPNQNFPSEHAKSVNPMESEAQRLQDLCKLRRNLKPQTLVGGEE